MAHLPTTGKLPGQVLPGWEGKAAVSWGAKAGALLAGDYLSVIVSEAAPAPKERGAGGSWEHPVLCPGVTLPPRWEGGVGFAFGAVHSSALCPPAGRASTGWLLLGRPFLGQDLAYSPGDVARAASVSFSLLHPAWLVLLVMPAGLSQPSKHHRCSSKIWKVPFHGVPWLRRGRSRALPLGCTQGTQLLAGWWHPKVALPTSPP